MLLVLRVDWRHEAWTVRKAPTRKNWGQGLSGKEGVLRRALDKSPFLTGFFTKPQLKGKRKLHHWPFSERGRLPLGSVPATRPGVRLDPGGLPSQVTVLTLHWKRARKAPMRTRKQTSTSRIISLGTYDGESAQISRQRWMSGKARER